MTLCSTAVSLKAHVSTLVKIYARLLNRIIVHLLVNTAQLCNLLLSSCHSDHFFIRVILLLPSYHHHTFLSSLKLQETRYENKYGGRAFSHVAPKLWNLLPKSMRDISETDKFKTALKSFLMIRGEEFFQLVNRR